MAPWLADCAIPTRFSAGFSASARLVNVRFPVTATLALKERCSTASTRTFPPGGTVASCRLLPKLGSENDSWTRPDGAASNRYAP